MVSMTHSFFGNHTSTGTVHPKVGVVSSLPLLLLFLWPLIFMIFSNHLFSDRVKQALQEIYLMTNV